MARILHVDDEPYWRQLISRALSRDHRVDSTGSFEGAIELLEQQSYDLAIIDLNLIDDGDGIGGEILDHLRETRPVVRCIVVTGSPPTGPLRKQILDRYGVDEIIIKTQHASPELRSTVERSLRRNMSLVGQAHERFDDWVPFRGHVVDHLADTSPDGAALQARFAAERQQLDRLLARIETDEEAAAFIRELERIESGIAELIRRIESPEHDV